jgi:ubiquitin C-terminal hydrolase
MVQQQQQQEHMYQYMYAGVPPPMQVNPYGYAQYMPQNPYMPMPYGGFVNPYVQPYYPQAYANGGYGKGYYNANGLHKYDKRNAVNGRRDREYNSKRESLRVETPETTPVSTTPPMATTPATANSLVLTSSNALPALAEDVTNSTSSGSTSVEKAKEPAIQADGPAESTSTPEIASTADQELASTLDAPAAASACGIAPLPTSVLTVPATLATTDAADSRSALATISADLPTEDFPNAPLSYPIFFNCTPTKFAENFSPMVLRQPDDSDVGVVLHRDLDEVVEFRAEEHSKNKWADVLQKAAVVHQGAADATEASTAPSILTSAAPLAAVTVQPAASGGLSGEGGEGPFPLGVLLLKLMFEPSFSLFSPNLPLFKIRPRGLTNTGNICYMNAVLQVLLYTEPFNRLLKLIEQKLVGSLLGHLPTPLLDMTISFINEFYAGGNPAKALSPERFYFSLIKLPKFCHLKWGQQEDAEEFLGYFLDGLHEEFVTALKNVTADQLAALGNHSDEVRLQLDNNMKIIRGGQESEAAKTEDDGWNEVSGHKVAAKRTVEIEPTPITALFGGQFRLVLTVPKAKESQSITLDPFQCIQLDISDDRINTIEDAFRIFAEPESIPYKTATGQVLAKKQTFIDQMPSVMIIHLKRFLYSGTLATSLDTADSASTASPTPAAASISTNDDHVNTTNDETNGIGKLRKRVQYKHLFTLPQECILLVVKKQQQGLARTYRLIGVVYHHGSSTDGGHYTCDVLRRSLVFDEDEELARKKVDGEWIRIDDTQVQPVDRDEVFNGEEGSKTAYILVYQKLERTAAASDASP